MTFDKAGKENVPEWTHCNWANITNFVKNINFLNFRTLEMILFGTG